MFMMFNYLVKLTIIREMRCLLMLCGGLLVAARMWLEGFPQQPSLPNAFTFDMPFSFLGYHGGKGNYVGHQSQTKNKLIKKPTCNPLPVNLTYGK